MQAMQDMIASAGYQDDEANGDFNTDAAVSTVLPPVPSCQYLGISHDERNISSATPAGAHLFNSAGTQQRPRSTVTPESASDITTQRVSGSTPSSGGGDSPESGPSKIRKRQRNTEAARRYRQRKLDRVSELEEALEAMSKERDDLRLKLAKAEAEAGVLRSLVGK